MTEIKRGDIFYCNYSAEYVGSEQAGQRPVLVISNDVGNFHSPNVIVAAISSKRKKTAADPHEHHAARIRPAAVQLRHA